MPAQNHTHKYKKVRLKANKKFEVWACQLNCSHYLQKEFLPGKLSICWKCLKEFELTKSLIKAKPTCKECKITKEVKPVDSILKSLGI